MPPAYSPLHYFSPGRLTCVIGLHQNHLSSFFLSNLPDSSQSLEFLSALQLVYFTSVSTLDYGSNLGKVIKINTVGFS